MNAIPKREVENARFCEKSVPRLDDRFMTNIKGKDFVLYAGVLDLATQKGLLKLEVELLQFPTKENGNEAICRAVAESKNGEVFSDIGDANPKNCHSMIVKHLIRMASTRAKGRALRDMCNIGIACLEELADFDDVIGSSGAPKKTTRKKTAGNKPYLPAIQPQRQPRQKPIPKRNLQQRINRNLRQMRSNLNNPPIRKLRLNRIIRTNPRNLKCQRHRSAQFIILVVGVAFRLRSWSKWPWIPINVNWRT